MADGRGAEAIHDDLDELLAFRRLQEPFGRIELDALGRKALQRDAAHIDRPLGDLGGEALAYQGVEDIGGGAAALHVVRHPLLPFLRKVRPSHPKWTAANATGLVARPGPPGLRARLRPVGKPRTP